MSPSEVVRLALAGKAPARDFKEWMLFQRYVIQEVSTECGLPIMEALEETAALYRQLYPAP